MMRILATALVVLSLCGSSLVAERTAQLQGTWNTVALLDRGAADGLGEVALAGAGRSEQEHVLALGNETRGRELVDFTTAC
jgi:hypothetical protein